MTCTRCGRKAVLGLCVIAVLLSGCASVNTYRVGNKTYFSRAKAEAELQKNWDESVKQLRSNMKKCDKPIAEKCVLVMPARHWIDKNMFIKKDVGVSPDVVDYVIVSLEKMMRSHYELFQESGLFKSCEFVKAVDGNGAGENLSSEGAFEIRIIMEKKKKRWNLELFSPDGKRSYLFPDGWLDDTFEQLKNKIKEMS